MPGAALNIMQRGIPMLDINPANLYRIENWKDYDTFDLKVGRKWGNWDVAAIFNYDGLAKAKTLDLSKLRLSSEYVHVFEYWSSTYVGKNDCNARISCLLEPYDAKVFAIVPAVGSRPVLLSTSRHVTQGALDLAEIVWSGGKDEWTVSGKSTNLAAGKIYELVFAGNNYKIADVNSPAVHKINSEKGIARVSFVPDSSTADWQVVFKPISNAAIILSPETINLQAGATAQLTISNLAPNAVDWQLSSSDPRIKLSCNNGKLAAYPACTTITVTADANGFSEPGLYESEIIASGPENSKSKSRIIIPVRSENLAGKARLTVSSCADGFNPKYAVDNDTHTAWCSTVKDKDGAWIELKWDKPVTISRVVLDECTAQFEQITEWHIEVGDGNALKTAANGDILERRKTVQFANPCRTSRIRFVVDKSRNMPGLWEFEIYEK
jgi:hypothetical protein